MNHECPKDPGLPVWGVTLRNFKIYNGASEVPPAGLQTSVALKNLLLLLLLLII